MALVPAFGVLRTDSGVDGAMLMPHPTGVLVSEGDARRPLWWTTPTNPQGRIKCGSAEVASCVPEPGKAPDRAQGGPGRGGGGTGMYEKGGRRGV